MKLHIAFSALLLCILSDSVVSEHWHHHTVLDGDGRYHLYWNPPVDDEITFKVEVEAKGYVGFGLSPNGGMSGSDILVAWIKNGKSYFQDRYAEGYVLMLDKIQDWKLTEGYENETHTVFKIRRKLDTCDEQDRVIDNSTMRIIYAYSEQDPDSDEPFYHGEKRGSKSILLLQNKVHGNADLDFSSLLHWDIQSPGIDISDNKSMYWCKIFKTPQVSEKHHIVYVKPLIQEGHEPFVHHMLLYECVGGDLEEYETFVNFSGHQCRHPNMPDAMKRCEGVSIAWAVGGEDLIFPKHVGFPLEPDPGTYFMLEVHYDNQQLKEGIIDHSGLRMYYTPDVREYDAGCLMIGSTISPRLFVPPGQDEYVVAGHSNPDCLGPEFPEAGVKGLGVLLHAHLLGRRIKARHFRGNKELHPLAEEKNYDFNYQEYRYFPEEVEILADDQITIECTYNSSGRDDVTFGGERTDEEMCLAFILYYPRVDRYASLSVPTFDNINKILDTNSTDLEEISYVLLQHDWTKDNISEVEYLMRYSEQDSHCYLGNGEKNSVESRMSYPNVTQPFVMESTCNNSVSLGEKNDTHPFVTEASRKNSVSLRKALNLHILLCIACLILFSQK